MDRSRTSVVVVIAGLLITGVMGIGATYKKSQTPKILSKWKDSSDGKISMCLAINKTTFSSSEDIVIRCAIRNNTDGPLLILRPFGDAYYAMTGGLHILGPEGEIKYDGPIKEYVLGTGSFHELRSGMVIDETFKISKKYLKGLSNPGLYNIKYKYLSSGYPKSPTPENLWKGRIDAESVQVLVMHK